MQPIDIIGAPSDLGANTRGSNMGPAAIRIAGLVEAIKAIGYECEDIGDVEVPVRETLPKEHAEQKFYSTIYDICCELKIKVYDAQKKGHLPIMLGGDHSLAMGSISGQLEHFADIKQGLGVIWVDAHADINTPESSPSGNLHGMPVAALIGLTQSTEFHSLLPSPSVLNPENIVLVGIRQIDQHEKELCRKSGVRYYTMRDIDEKGISSVMKSAIKHASKGTAGLHLSFDLDGIDPAYAPGVSTPVLGGLTYREAHLIMEMVADTRRLCGIDMVELNPLTDSANKTASLAVELITSALGKSIL